MNQVRPAENELRADVVGGLERGEFFLLYQAEIDLTTNRFAGVEALIRWRHSSGVVLAPNEFWLWLRDAQQLGDLERWVVTMACEQGAEWHAMGYRFVVGVNCSTEQLLDRGFVGNVLEALDTSRFNAQYLAVELPTTSFTDARTSPVLRELRRLGVTVTLDNFQPTPELLAEKSVELFDCIKLDRSLAATEELDLGELLAWAHAHEIRLVASGIEDPLQYQRFRDLRIDGGQGFLLAQPVSVLELNAFLEDYALFSGRLL
jgi:EAL domain-containing protein (putative c-di-GMP-specific phosphodiesterase class I)